MFYHVWFMLVLIEFTRERIFVILTVINRTSYNTVDDKRLMPVCMYVQLQKQCGTELCIVVTNLSRMCSEYCTTQTCPDLPIRAAVRMSMAFPGLCSIRASTCPGWITFNYGWVLVQ